VAEHLRFEQRLGESGAIDRHQLAGRATAVAVDELRDHLLPRATLPGDHDRRICLGDATCELDRAVERGRGPQQQDLFTVAALAEHRLLRFARLACEQHRVRGATEQDLQMGGREGLRQIIPGSRTQRLDARGDARVAGHHHNDGFTIGRQRRAEQLHARHDAHVEIDEHDVEAPPPKQLQRLVATTDRADVVPVHLEHTRTPLAEGAIVVDDEHLDGCAKVRGDFPGIVGARVLSRRLLVWRGSERRGSHSVLLRSERGYSQTMPRSRSHIYAKDVASAGWWLVRREMRGERCGAAATGEVHHTTQLVTEKRADCQG